MDTIVMMLLIVGVVGLILVMVRRMVGWNRETVEPTWQSTVPLEEMPELAPEDLVDEPPSPVMPPLPKKVVLRGMAHIPTVPPRPKSGV